MKFSPKYFAFATVVSLAAFSMATPVETASALRLLNGSKLNGLHVNGQRLNALSVNGTALSRTANLIATLDGKPVEALSLEGSQLVLQVGSSAAEQ